MRTPVVDRHEQLLITTMMPRRGVVLALIYYIYLLINLAIFSTGAPTNTEQFARGKLQSFGVAPGTTFTSYLAELEGTKTKSDCSSPSEILGCNG